MSNDLISAFSGVPEVSAEDIVSLNIGFKKRTGERFAKATTSDGRTFIKTLSRTGVETDSVIKIPAYSTREERDEIIQDLSADYVQDDIADMLDISQSTVSISLSKSTKRKKKK